MELDEFHVLNRNAGPVGHRWPVARVCNRVCRVIERLAIAAGRQHDAATGFEADQVAALDVISNTAMTFALFRVGVVRHGEVHYVVLVVDSNPSLDDLLVHRMQQVVACLRARISRPREGEPAERPLRDPAIVLARERHPPVFELDGFFGTVVAQRFDGRRVTKVIRPFHGVIRVVHRIVAVAKRRVNATLCRPRVRPDRVELRDDGDVRSLFVGRDGRS